eukprot:c12937_g1_i2.p1 GENE.c12937_g1_i2~~c12937_g1_i2.p1  ORF type:complete len:663 (-),score=152.37 c12937_g1_i2:49-2037(-)
MSLIFLLSFQAAPAPLGEVAIEIDSDGFPIIHIRQLNGEELKLTGSLKLSKKAIDTKLKLVHTRLRTLRKREGCEGAVYAINAQQHVVLSLDGELKKKLKKHNVMLDMNRSLAKLNGLVTCLKLQLLGPPTLGETVDGLIRDLVKYLKKKKGKEIRATLDQQGIPMFEGLPEGLDDFLPPLIHKGWILFNKTLEFIQKVTAQLPALNTQIQELLESGRTLPDKLSEAKKDMGLGPGELFKISKVLKKNLSQLKTAPSILSTLASTIKNISIEIGGNVQSAIRETETISSPVAKDRRDYKLEEEEFENEEQEIEGGNGEEGDLFEGLESAEESDAGSDNENEDEENEDEEDEQGGVHGVRSIIVLGSSGSVGSAAVESIAALKKFQGNIYAGVRNIRAQQTNEFKSNKRIKVVEVNMSDVGSCAAVLRSVNAEAVFIVVPAHHDRTHITLNAIKACESAGNVKLMTVLSVTTASISNGSSIFQSQFAPIEAAVRSSRVPCWCLVRVPLFHDNNFSHVQSIRDTGIFYGPQDPNAFYTPICVGDIGKAVAAILTDEHPEHHSNKTYELVMPAISMSQLAEHFSQALHKPVKYVQIPYEVARTAYLGMGFPEWQTDGILELFHMIDQGVEQVNLPQNRWSDFEVLTGKSATTSAQWCLANAGVFS